MSDYWKFAADLKRTLASGSLLKLSVNSVSLPPSIQLEEMFVVQAYVGTNSQG